MRVLPVTVGDLMIAPDGRAIGICPILEDAVHLRRLVAVANSISVVVEIVRELRRLVTVPGIGLLKGALGA
jgi:hypothetical protein